MTGRILNGVVKVTGWPAWKVLLRTKIHYEDESIQGRKIDGPAIIISNHTSVYDYAEWLFVFFGRTLHVQAAEVLYKKKLLGLFLKLMGAVYVDRESKDPAFVWESEEIVRDGGVMCIFPESRIPLPQEERPLPFKPSAAYLALSTGAKVIPVFTDGAYFGKKKANVVIGKPFEAIDFYDDSLSERENLIRTAEIMRGKVKKLGTLLEKKNAQDEQCR